MSEEEIAHIEPRIQTYLKLNSHVPAHAQNFLCRRDFQFLHGRAVPHKIYVPYELREHCHSLCIFQAFEVEHHIFIYPYILAEPYVMLLEVSPVDNLAAHHHVCHGHEFAHVLVISLDGYEWLGLVEAYAVVQEAYNLIILFSLLRAIFPDLGS